MNKFYAQSGQFWLDDQPQMIQAGEFHYFRSSQDQWENRLSYLKKAGFNSLATYIPWLWHQLQENNSDFDGHSHPMRNLQGFLDLAMEMGFMIIARPGPYIMAETRNEGIPPWVFEQYPQVAFINQYGKAENIASYLHPAFQDCVRKWYQAVFAILAPRQITRNGKIFLVQLDNEMGMMAWVRSILDINPDTLDKFGLFLQQSYGSTLAERYPTENLVNFLREEIQFPSERYGGRVVEDYRRFYRYYLRDYASFLLLEATSCGLEVPPVINIHGFSNGGKTFPIGLSQLHQVMRLPQIISATDVYPISISEGNIHDLILVNEVTKSLQNPDQALFSIEFQAGGNLDFGFGQTSLYDLYSRLCISTGMRAINHYLFFDGENDPILSPVKRHDWGHPVRKDGSLRKHYYRYIQLSKTLAAYGSELILAKPRTVATIGFILDYFMTEVNNKFTQESTNILTHQREAVLFDMLARGLSLTHRPFNVIELEGCELDPSETPVCWVMMEKVCTANIQQKLVNYLHRGGKLFMAGRICLEDDDHQECTIVKEAIGIQQVESDPPFQQGTIHAFNYPDVPATFIESYSGTFDEVFATRLSGETVGFITSVGKGQVIMFGAAVPANTLDDLEILNQIALKTGIQPLFHLSNWADVRISQGKKGAFLFLNNYQDDPVETIIQYEEKHLFNGYPVRIPPRRGVILPLDWHLRDGIIINYITSEISEVQDGNTTLSVKTAQPEFLAELTLSGYDCQGATTLDESGLVKRVRLEGKEGLILLHKAVIEQSSC
jgi:beta-galactosidase